MTLSNNRSLIAVWLFFMVAVTPVHAMGGIPTDQIKSTVDKALVVLKDPRLKSANKFKERRAQLKQILFARFDFTEMGKRSLGPEWRRRTPAEQEEFVHLFTEVLERAYARTIESYTDEKIVYVGEKLDGSYADVSSKILTNKGQEYSIDYKVQLVGSEWKVYDVVVENISMVNNFRSQFATVINKFGYDELVHRLRTKAEVGTDDK
jgi:phospholipid transport system substrate-binding protein